MSLEKIHVKLKFEENSFHLCLGILQKIVRSVENIVELLVDDG